ncbi:MAG: hypothetical protein WC269_04560 [Candidatus Gracilibacteria bacterium]|jgi:hypothetical protein
MTNNTQKKENLIDLILELKDENDKKTILRLLESSRGNITPEIEQKIKEAFKKEVKFREKELKDLENEKTQVVEYRKSLEKEATNLEKQLNKDTAEVAGDIETVNLSFDKAEEGEKEEKTEAEAEALRDKLLNK